jgi:hypothetical protein
LVAYVFATVILAAAGCTSRSAERPGAADSSSVSAKIATVAGIPDSLLILPGRIGRIELGMTIAQAREAIPSATFERTADGDGVALVAVTLGNFEGLLLYAGEEDPRAPIDGSKRIERMEAVGAAFRTPEGVHPGSPIADVERTYGRTTRIVRSEIESREFIEFQHSPLAYVFRLNGTGEFPEGSRETTRYDSSAAIQSIEISGGGQQ